MPNITNFLSLPQAVGSETGLHPFAVPPDPCSPSRSVPAHAGSALVTMPSPQSPGAMTSRLPQQNLITAVPCVPPVSPSSPDLVWANVLAVVQCLLAPNPVTPSVSKPGVKWDALGSAFLDVDARMSMN